MAAAASAHGGGRGRCRRPQSPVRLSPRLALWAAVLALSSGAAFATLTVSKPMSSSPYRIFRPGDTLTVAYATANPSPGSSTVNLDLHQADGTWVLSVLAGGADGGTYDYVLPSGLSGAPGDFKVAVYSAYESSSAFSAVFTVKTNPEQASYPLLNGTATVQIGATYAFAQLPLSAGISGFFSAAVWRLDGPGLGFVYVSSPVDGAVTNGLAVWTVPNALSPGDQFVLMLYDYYTPAKWAWTGTLTAAASAPAITVSKPPTSQAFELAGRQLAVELAVAGGSISTVTVDAYIFDSNARGAKLVHSFGTFAAGGAISLTLPDITASGGSFPCGRAYGLPLGSVPGAASEDAFRWRLLVRSAANPIVGAVSNDVTVAKFTTTWSFAAPAAAGVLYQENPYTVLWNDIPSVAGCSYSGYLTARLYTYTPGVGYVNVGPSNAPPDFLNGINGGNTTLTVPSAPGGVFAAVPAVGSTVAIVLWDPYHIGTLAISPHMTLAAPSASAKRIEWLPGMPLVYRSPEGTTATNAPMADPTPRTSGGFLFSGQSLDLRWRVFGPVDAIKIETMSFAGGTTRCFVPDAAPLAASVPAAAGFYSAVLPDGLIPSGFTVRTLFLRLSDAADPSIVLVSGLVDLYQPSTVTGTLLEPTGAPPLPVAVGTSVVFRWSPVGYTSGFVTFHFFAPEPDCMAGKSFVRYSTRLSVVTGTTPAGSGYDRYAVTVPSYACGTKGYFYINDGYSYGIASNGLRLLTPLLCFTGAGCPASACAAAPEPSCATLPTGPFIKVDGGTLVVTGGGFVCIGSC